MGITSDTDNAARSPISGPPAVDGDPNRRLTDRRGAGNGAKHRGRVGRNCRQEGRGTEVAGEARRSRMAGRRARASLPGSILPAKRIVAFYEDPLVKRMGVLGEYPPDQMLMKLDSAVALWRAADPRTPVQPALHLVACVAKDSAGKDGKYRQRSDTGLIEKVYGWAHEHHAILFLDVQVGQSTLKDELPRLLPFLARPDVHLGIDPEFSMKHGEVPGTKIGTFDVARTTNYASRILDSLVVANKLPPKILVVHRFTRDMLTGYRTIKLDPRVQIVINMDGWGPPAFKIETYRQSIYPFPVEYTGFKLFYPQRYANRDSPYDPC